MVEELQHLIDRIKQEGVETAEQQGAQIVAKAKEKAAAIVKEGEQKAKALLEDAERNSEAFTERSTKTLEQAARDLLISVGQGVENILADIVAESVEKALSVDVLKQMLVKMAEALKLTSSPRWRFNRRRQTMFSAALIAAMTIIANPTGASPPKKRRSTSTNSITAKPIKSHPDRRAARTLTAGERPTA